MEESPDSRTASFDRKRAHAAISLEPQDYMDSTDSTPHKRLRDGGFDNQHSKVNVLVSGDSSLNAGGLEISQYNNSGDFHLDSKIDDRPEVTRFDRVTNNSGTIPSVNWNSGTKAMIRTSLGRDTVNTTHQTERPKVGENEISKNLGLMKDQTLIDTKQLIRFNSPSSPSRSTSKHSTSPDHIVELNISIPMSNEPTRTRVESKSISTASITNVSLSPERIQEDHDTLTDSESDGGVVLNLQTIGQDSGEILEANLKNIAVSEKIIHDNFESDGEIKESEEDDVMMKHFQSNPTTHKNEIVSDVPTKKPAQISRLPTLADLNPEELKLQLRYFYISKSLDTIDRDSLVRCLVCAQEGHMAELCSDLTCGTCGAHKQHFTKNCPRTKRCAKCRERGHQESSCRYKLQRLMQYEMTCDLCQRDGHNEDNCELLWRTSGRPWESDLTDRRIRLECYECGGAGHLGNDCGMRRPTKWMGTSTWSLPGRKRSTNISQRGISIKGRAQQQSNIALDDSEDDGANFFRSKAPEPPRKGQIRMATQHIGEHRPITRSQSKNNFSSWNPNNEPNQGDVTRNPRGGDSYSHQSSGSSRPRDQGQYSYRPDDRRSISPHYPARSSISNADCYRPPAYGGQGGRNGRHQDKNQHGGNESYRPMPSAAQKAWSRHRL